MNVRSSPVLILVTSFIVRNVRKDMKVAIRQRDVADGQEGANQVDNDYNPVQTSALQPLQMEEQFAQWMRQQFKLFVMDDNS